MAVMTGSLRDFAYRRLNYNSPQITFTPSGPGVRSDILFASMPVTVTPDEQGEFTVNLEPTEGVVPKVWYKIRIEWQDLAGNFGMADEPDWVLVVPAAGGRVAQNIAVVEPDRIITKGEPGDASEVTIDEARKAAGETIQSADLLYADDPRALRAVESLEYAVPVADRDGFVAGGVQTDGSFNFERAPRVMGVPGVTLHPLPGDQREWAIPFVDQGGSVAGGIRSDGSAEFFKLRISGQAALFMADESIGYTRSSPKRVACIGDSLTAGYFPGTTVNWSQAAYPGVLRGLLPSDVEVFNLGTSGFTVDEEALRVGALPLPLTVAGGSIPASGPVSVSTTTVIGWRPAGTERNIPGSLAGVPGTLTRKDSDFSFTFTRATAGAATPVPDGTLFRPDFAGHEADTVVIMLGRNNIPGIVGRDGRAEDNVVNGVKRIVDWLTPQLKQVLVLPPTTNSLEKRGTPGHTSMVEIGNRLKQMYPSKVLDIRTYLVQQAIYDLGITPTTEDVANIEGDTLPPSIMLDITHYKPEAAALVAARVHDYLVTRGWV